MNQPRRRRRPLLPPSPLLYTTTMLQLALERTIEEFGIIRLAPLPLSLVCSQHTACLPLPLPYTTTTIHECINKLDIRFKILFCFFWERERERETYKSCTIDFHLPKQLDPSTYAILPR